MLPPVRARLIDPAAPAGLAHISQPLGKPKHCQTVIRKLLNRITERLLRAWHDAEAIRDMPELFTEEKLAQITGAAMAAIEEAWQALGV